MTNYRFVEYLCDFFDLLQDQGKGSESVEYAALKDVAATDLSSFPTNEAGEHLISGADFDDLIDAAIKRRRGPTTQH
jgi:hypothetical protein